MNVRNLFFLIITSSIAGCGDTRIASSNYFITNDYSHRDLWKKEESSNLIVVDENVVDYSVNGNYLHVLRAVAVSYECANEKQSLTILTHYTDIYEYWIVDLVNKREFGPLSHNEYFNKSINLGLTPAKLKKIEIKNTDLPVTLDKSKKCKVISKLNREYQKRYLEE